MKLVNNEWIPCVSFDFDGTLNTDRGYNFFLYLRHLNIATKITTSRSEKEDNSDLYKFCDENLVLRKDVTFTNKEYKYKVLVFDTDIDVHLDDDIVEIRKLNNIRSFIIPVYVKLNKWEITACRALNLDEEDMAVYYHENGLPWCGIEY